MPNEKTIKFVISLGTIAGFLLGLFCLFVFVTGIREGEDFSYLGILGFMVFGWGYSMWGYLHIRKNGWFKDWFKS